MVTMTTTAWWSDLLNDDLAANVFSFACGDYGFVYDVNTNSLHGLDQAALQVLEALVACGGNGDKAREQLQAAGALEKSVIDEVLEELGALKAAGLLFTKDLWREQFLPAGTAVAEDVVAGLTKEAGTPLVKAMCLHIAHDCNLRCTYCFAGTGPFGGDRSMMSEEVGRQAIDFLMTHSQGRRHVEIDFFGGEPLMNLDVVRALVRYAKEKAREYNKILKLTLTTNGVLLDEEAGRFLNEEGLSVVLSLDGRREVHDRMRPYVDGTGSYNEVLPNLQAFVESRGHRDYYVRGTFTRENLDFAADVLHMHDCGFRELSVEPVVGDPGEDYALREEDLAAMDKAYRQLAEEILARRAAGQPMRFFHFELDLAHGPCLAKRLSGCGAGSEYMAVAPNGDLYPCHQFVGQEAYRLGSVTEGVQRPALSRQFAEAHIYHKQDCPTCWARFLCSGGCHANNAGANGDLLIPARGSCALAKMRLKWALYAKVLEGATER
ncbi:uncharacterized protein EDD73_13420 [Heliophilum fasciatum]|uniref:Radical SAM core domain-containing protein n=2 Tax=Heliophilum fasciatum TaxID=35700 RepID=A0A4R2REG7_9FIRM|nr:uncharacterized protein [Heliophilum fasciatum]TCP60788.1 uncharacterized protein EDD73_13420 [Heliophilum fasciatum]